MSGLSFQPVNPRPLLDSLAGRQIVVRLKWGTEYRGFLVSADSYMNLQAGPWSGWGGGRGGIPGRPSASGAAAAGAGVAVGAGDNVSARTCAGTEVSAAAAAASASPLPLSFRPVPPRP